MSDDRYLKLKDHIGLHHETGELDPIREVGVAVAVPTIEGDEIVEVSHRVTLHPIPGTRVLKVENPQVANALLASGQYDEIDPPNEAGLKKLRGEIGSGETPQLTTAAQLEKAAHDRGIFDEIQGTGANGTVLKRDIEAALKADDERHVGGANTGTKE